MVLSKKQREKKPMSAENKTKKWLIFLFFRNIANKYTYVPINIGTKLMRIDEDIKIS